MPARVASHSNELYQDGQAVTSDDVNGGDWWAAVHPDDHAGMEEAWAKAQASLVSEGAFDQHGLPDIGADALHLGRLRKLDMYSAMVLPLVARGSTLGAITRAT